MGDGPGRSDLLLAMGVAGLLISQVAAGELRGPLWMAVIGGVCLAACVVAVRRYPWPALASAFATILAISLLGVSSEGNYAEILAGSVVLYRVASRKTFRESVAALTVAVAAALGAAVPESGLVKASFAVFVLGGVTGCGRVVAAHRDLARRLEDAAAELNAQRRELVAAELVEEKVKIARELHDVIAHAVSVIVIQASAAEGMLDVEPCRARAPLEAIQDSGRQALDELRRLLSVLRPGDERATPLAPQPGLAAVAGLADSLRDAGIEVRLKVDRGSTSIPPGLELAVFRIVQEAFTNVLKHSDASQVIAVVRRSAHLIEVEVTDNGPGASNAIANGYGHGLDGMRERVCAYDGDLFAGPRPEGGFRVSARLEVPDRP